MTEMRADLLSQPGSATYRAATAPQNATVVQRPVMVAHPGRAEEVAQAVQWAAQRNLGVAVQASGHGAGTTTNPGSLRSICGDNSSTGLDPRLFTMNVKPAGCSARYTATQTIYHWPPITQSGQVTPKKRAQLPQPSVTSTTRSLSG